MGRWPVSCRSLTRRLSATVSPPSITRTRRGESSKYRVCGRSTVVSKLKTPLLRSPNGPLSTVSAMCAPISVALPICYTRGHKEHSCAEGAGSVYWPCPIRATDASPENVFRRKRKELWRRRATHARERGWKRAQTYGEREQMLRETGTAEVNGAEFYFEVVGEGEPLVLVHAGIADSRMWEGQITAFADRYRVIRYDMLGFGRTQIVEGPFSHHEDLRGLLDFLDIDRAHLVGCSMGGGAVLDFALEYPDRIGNLVLVGSAVGGFRPEIDPPKQWDELVAADEAGDLERISELEVQIWVDGPGRSPDFVDASVRDLVREMNLIALRNEALELGEEWEPDPAAADRLPDVQATTLLIVGDEDQPRVLAAADLLEKELPNVRKVVMHGTAHVPNMERPEEFDRIVLEFLKDHS